MIIAPMAMIAMMIATVAGMKYWSAIDAGCGLGAAVAAGASSTVM